MKPHTQGFTLIELLVVIAIIGVLAALLLPSYRDSTKRPNDVAALQCGRAVRIALTVYKTENQTIFPDQGVATLLGEDVQEACQGVQVNWFDTTGLTVNSTGNGKISGYSGGNCFLTWSKSGTRRYEFQGCGTDPKIVTARW